MVVICSQVVVRVVHFARGSFEVSTDLSSAAAAAAGDEPRSSSSSCSKVVLHVGAIVPGNVARVVSVHQNGVLLLLAHCSRPSAKQQQQQQQGGEGLLGFVPTLHLADEVPVALSLQNSLQVTRGELLQLLLLHAAAACAAAAAASAVAALAAVGAAVSCCCGSST